MIMLFISIRSEGNIPVMKVVNFRKTGENENIEYHGKYIRVDISYSLLGQNPLITFLMDETVKQKKLTLAKSCQNWCERFHGRR